MMTKFWKAAIWSNRSAHIPANIPKVPSSPPPKSAKEITKLRQYKSDEFQSYAKNKINPPNDKSFQGGRYEKSVKI